MAARLLRRTSNAASIVGAWVVVLPAVPATRAAVGKAVVANIHNTLAQTFCLRVGGVMIANVVTLTPGETYVEPGLVVLAGETIEVWHQAGGTAGNIQVTFFGEEVDN